MARRELFAHHNRIKGEKKSQKNKDIRVMDKLKPIVNKEFMTWLHEVEKPSCFSCGRPYFYISPLDKMDLHHIKEGSTDVKNDEEVIALCSIKCHKDGQVLSVHSTPVKFREVYPIKTQKFWAVTMFIKFKKYVTGIHKGESDDN